MAEVGEEGILEVVVEEMEEAGEEGEVISVVVEGEGGTLGAEVEGEI